MEGLTDDDILWQNYRGNLRVKMEYSIIHSLCCDFDQDSQITSIRCFRFATW